MSKYLQELCKVDDFRSAVEESQSRKHADQLSAAEIEKELGEVVIGHPKAVKELSVVLAEPAVKDPQEPESILLVGGPGVGKTYTAEQCAKLLGRPFYRIDFGGMIDDLSLNAHIGSPRGTYGSESEGRLTQALRPNPKTIIGGDEVEKAPETGKVHDWLLSGLDQGSYKDQSSGLDVDCRRTIWIFTTNAIWEKFDELNRTLADDSRIRRNAFKRCLEQAHFHEALLSRIGTIIYLSPLGPEAMGEIASRHLVNQAARYDITLGKHRSHAAILAEAIQVGEALSRYGARELKHWVKQTFSPAFQELRREHASTVTLAIKVARNGEIEVTPRVIAYHETSKS